MKSREQPLRLRNREPENSWALGVTWHIPRSHRHQFRKGVERKLMPHLSALHDAMRIVAMLPFHHRPLKVREEGGYIPWTDYWVIVLAAREDPDEIWHSIERPVRASAEGIQGGLLQTEVLRPQPNIGMYYPRIGGLRREPRWHWIEYVVSRPETRDEYYRDQYLFSGPVIRHFYEANAVGRCIGFERMRFLKNDGTLPEWDVVHITGFTPVRLAQVIWDLWRFMPVFDNLARKIGYTSALAVLRSWDVKRVKYQRLATQDTSYTLQPMHDAVLVPKSPAWDG
jgi:hypothetical protein